MTSMPNLRPRGLVAAVWAVCILFATPGPSAAGDDLRLVEAVQRQDGEAARALIDSQDEVLGPRRRKGGRPQQVAWRTSFDADRGSKLQAPSAEFRAPQTRTPQTQHFEGQAR